MPSSRRTFHPPSSKGVTLRSQSCRPSSVAIWARAVACASVSRSSSALPSYGWNTVSRYPGYFVSYTACTSAPLLGFECSALRLTSRLESSRMSTLDDCRSTRTATCRSRSMNSRRAALASGCPACHFAICRSSRARWPPLFAGSNSTLSPAWVFTRTGYSYSNLIMRAGYAKESR